MEMEGLAYDLPLPVHLQKAENIGKPVASTIFHFHANAGKRIVDVYTGNTVDEPACGRVRIYPVVPPTNPSAPSQLYVALLFDIHKTNWASERNH